MTIRTLCGAIVIAAIGCAGSTPGPSGDSLPTSRSELSAELIEAGAVRVTVERVVESFRGLAISRVASNVESLRGRVEEFEPAQREAARPIVAAMPSRFKADLDVFLASVDFESLALDLYAPLYAERFDVEELQGILRFFRSPAGQAFARESPVIASDATVLLVSRLEPTLESFMRQWFDTQLQSLQLDLAPPGATPREPAGAP